VRSATKSAADVEFLGVRNGSQHGSLDPPNPANTIGKCASDNCLLGETAPQDRSDGRHSTLSRSGVSPRIIYEPTPSLLAGRHCGARKSSGDLLVFIDDDIEVTSAWLESIRSAFENPKVALVGGPSFPEFSTTPPDWLKHFWSEENGIKACPYLSLLDGGCQRMPIRADLVWGLNFSIRRSVLIEQGGFHPDGVPWPDRRFRGDGESGLATGLEDNGLLAVYEPGAAVRHLVPAERLRIEYFEERAFLQGISDSYRQLRYEYGLYAPKPKRSWLKRLGKRAQRFVQPTGSSAPQQPREVERVRTAQQQGFEYHQSEVASDPALLAWVTRRDYWDYVYPQTKQETACPSKP
jgi:hypothetical protein